MGDSELEEMKSFYDDVYYADAKKTLQGSAHLRRLAHKISVRQGQLVLDVACGLGEWLYVCRSVGAGVSGIDLSERAIEFCETEFKDGQFFAQPAERLPFPDGRFDIVSCLGSLEHFVDPVVALKEMVRVATSNGQFLILVPNADFLTRKLKLFRGTNQKDAKEVVRTLDEWERLLEQGGMHVVRRWKDLHVLSWGWIGMNGLAQAPIRAMQALALAVWPLKWQYQVYHLCEKA